MHFSHSQWMTHYAQALKWQVSRNNAFLGSSQYNCPWHSRFTPSAFRRRYFFLKQHNFNVIVRNSGGLAVVLDEGVLNVSLLFQETEKGIDIDLGYDTMWHLIKEMLKDYDVTIEAKEIVGSYCPGSYDLSIRDQKFAGISQRRIRGVAVQIYLCATGSGSERAALVRDFYNLAIQGEETRFTYPEIVPSTILHSQNYLAKPLQYKI